MLSRQQKLPLLALILLTLVLSGLSRFAQGRRVFLTGSQNWVTTDPDSLYHMRRVDRVLSEGLPVAGSDAYLNFPEGSAIPWPPYYTYISSALIAPFAPEGATARRAFVEEKVASLAMLFGVLATLMAALAGQVLAGRAGALVAGSYHALCQIAIAYGKLGNGDHHSFVSFLSGALLLLFTWVLARKHLRSVRWSLISGSCAGALCGLLIGTWVGGMMYLVQLELVLGWLVVRQYRDGREGLAPFGLAFHGAAFLALAPAVFASPWTQIEAWMVVNLSYFHLLFLALGGAVFVPLQFLGPKSRSLRLYPWIVATLLGALAGFLFLTDFAAARAVREGFDWASKTNEFMAGIRESRSLFAGDAHPGVSQELGFAFWLLPVAWLAAAWACFRRADLKLLPWVVCVPLLVLQSAQQARFAESLVLPLAVVLGWGAGRLFERQQNDALGRFAGSLRRLPPMAAAIAAVLLVALAHAASTGRTLTGLAGDRTSAMEQEGPTRIAVRQMASWLRDNSPSPPDYSVLANWGHGHTIEWAAERPSVATNFGSYVGEDGFRDPARFFMSEDPAQAKALLERHRARYVLLTSQLPDHLNSLIAMAAPEQRARWVDPQVEGKVLPAWFRTMGARLMFDGSVFMQDEIPSLSFLRLISISPISDASRSLRAAQDISPAAWLWERVEGAQVEAYGKPGTEFLIDMAIGFPRAQKLVQWRTRTVADESGRAVLRVPYSTRNTSSESRVRRRKWRFGNFSGEFELTESAVRDGARLLVHGNP